MGLSAKNRKLVGGAVLVGVLGGGGLVLSAINFSGDAAKTVGQQAPKIQEPGKDVINTFGDWGAAGVGQLGKLQTKLDGLSASTTTAPAAGAPAASGAAGNPDS